MVNAMYIEGTYLRARIAWVVIIALIFLGAA